MFKDRNGYQPGINNYVPAMQYAAALVHSQPADFNLGKPAATSATLFVSAGAANGATGTEIAVNRVLDSTYGRNVSMAISADPGNAWAVDVYGFDYLGQPMIERLTGANGSTTAVVGKKAFKRITKTRVATPSTNAVTFNLGTGSELGLPFKGTVLAAREGGVAKVVTVASAQLTESDKTDPATASTGDPRGTYKSGTALADFEIIVSLIGDPSVNANSNGGLHGIRHYAA